MRLQVVKYSTTPKYPAQIVHRQGNGSVAKRVHEAARASTFRARS